MPKRWVIVRIWACCLLGALSVKAPVACGSSENITVDLVRLLPQQPHTNEDLSIEVVGRVPQDALLQDPMQIGIDARVLFCRRVGDCMPVFHLNTTLCEALMDSGKECSGLKPGQTFSLSRTWHLPLLMVRGTYTLLLQFHRIHPEVAKARDAHPYEYYSNVINSQFYRPAGDVMSCYTLHEEVLASRQINILRDFRDAIIAFLIAASSSRAIGSHFPVWSRGILPQISGFLFIGILVGPYCANLVSQMHITIIGGMINKVSLAFFAGAAGAEIFLPELQGLLKPMALQVLLICTATVTFCATGIFFLESSQLLSVTSVSMQPNLMAKASISLLMGALMTARSPASAIAIIAELKCGDTKAGSMAIGITVLSDIAVLVLFALCSQLVRATSSGEDLGPYVLLGVFFELGISILMGYATGQLMRLALPPRLEADCQYDMCTKKGEEKAHRPQKSQIGSVLLGFLLIFILYAVFCVAEGCSDWTGGKLCLEPLLVCTVAACVCGHDELRREGLLEALAAWTPLVLLPFFTLAGASLQLSSLSQVLPAALCLVVLRALGVAAGSAGAGALSRLFLPQSHTSKETVQYTWLTLLAQAGVTLGLVLEVQHTFKGAWTQPFATLIISVVVINQLIGPVCCRFGLQKILAAEEQEEEDIEMGSCSPSSPSSDGSLTTPRSNRFHLAPKQTDRAGTQSVVYVQHPPLADGLVKKLNQF